ncbi:MAG: N-acetylmuramoyl-L-alanine amidase family protein [Acidimicrobiales bacterium]
MVDEDGVDAHGSRRLRVLRARAPAAALLAALAVAGTAIALATAGGAPPPTASVAPGGRNLVSEPAAEAGPAFSTSVAGGVAIDPSDFAPNACVAFGPTAGNAHHTVFLDAGHGGIDPGGRGLTEQGRVIYEARENLTIELETMNLLRARGFRVVVSRTADSDVVDPTAADLTGGALSVTGARAAVAARDVCANRARATILVGIYLDAGMSPLDAGCITAYDPARTFADKSRRLASFLQSDVLAKMNAQGWKIPDDGVQPDTTLGGIPLTTSASSYPHLLLLGPADPGWFTTPSQMPGALIEPLFISDPFEGSIATSQPGHRAIAGGIARAVERYFGVP